MLVCVVLRTRKGLGTVSSENMFIFYFLDIAMVSWPSDLETIVFPMFFFGFTYVSMSSH